jgi:hypothetical protein
VFGKALDVVGILAYEAGFEILDVLAERAGERFPDAGDAGVRLYGNDVPREVPTDDVTGDAGDFDIATIFFSRFENVVTQHPTAQQIIPAQFEEGEADDATLATIEAGALNPNFADELESRGRVLASALAEVGVSFGHSLELADGNRLQLGISPKYVQMRTFQYT